MKNGESSHLSIEYKRKIHRCKICSKIIPCPGNHKTERFYGGWACFDCFHSYRHNKMRKKPNPVKSLAQIKRQHDLIRIDLGLG